VLAVHLILVEEDPTNEHPDIREPTFYLRAHFLGDTKLQARCNLLLFWKKIRAILF